MLTLSTSRRLGSAAIPANLTTLSVSWLNNQFKAVAVHRGSVQGTWESPTDVEGSANFSALLREATERTGFRGQTVSLVLTHPRLVQQLVDVPPVKGTALKKLLQRQAQQQKLFPGEAAWACQTSPSNKLPNSVILHLFPKLMLDQLAQGARSNGLHLASVMPASAVLHRQLIELPLEKDETALLAAEAGGSITVVVGGRDGQILLVRTLSGNWNEGAERLAVDLNRTILFVNQQYGVTVNNGVWLFGRRAGEQAAVLQRQIQLPVRVSPVEQTPYYWAIESLKLAPALNPNFISPEQQKAPQRRVFAKLVALSTVLVVAGSLTATIYSWMAARQEMANIQSLGLQLKRLENQRENLKQRNAELNRKEQVVKLVMADRIDPVPVWFLAYIGQVLPPQLVVTNLAVNRSNELWKVQVAGTFQTSTNLTATEALDAITLLTTTLTGPPFHLRLATDAAREKERAEPPRTTASTNAVPDWVARVTTEVAARQMGTTQVVHDHFLIEGTMQ